jgi:hypothetical protein
MKRLAAWIPWILVIACAGRASASVSAHVRRGTAAVDLPHSCVLRVWEDVDSAATLVYAASVALDCAAATDSLAPETTLDEQVAGAAGAAARLTLRIDDPNFAFTFERHAPRDSFFHSGVSSSLAVRSHTQTRIEGAFRSGPQEIAGVETTVDLRFASAIDGGALAGLALPPGGGAPGKAFQEYLAALGRRDFAAIQRLTIGRAAGRALSGGFDAFRAREPRDAEVVGGELRGDVAHLRLRATTWSGDRIGTRVRMERSEEGAWRLRDRGPTTVNP